MLMNDDTRFVPHIFDEMLPDLKPDGTAICRLEVYDEDLNVFR